MIVLDTNVLSELLRPAPEPAVLAWFAGGSCSSAHAHTAGRRPGNPWRT
ncbi:hypothetical protein [Paraburkholderia oxyphila]|nr:hypothetical protein [Paraburkholderia oxyphila]